MRIRGWFVAMGQFSVMLAVPVAVVAASQDPLDSWARRTVPGLTASLNAVAYGNGVFVAVGDNSIVATSTDGSTWNVGSAGNYGNLSRVRFLEGQFVCVGSSDKILSSTNGQSWTAATLVRGSAWDVAYGNGVYVVGGFNGNQTSPNGTDWSSLNLQRIEMGSPRTILLNAVVFGNGRFVGLPYGLSVSGSVRPSFYSTNGFDWSEGTTGAPGGSALNGSQLLWGNDLFLGTSDFTANASVSADGASWCCLASPITAYGAALAHGSDYFLLVKQEKPGIRPSFYTSTNGIAWDVRFAEPIPLFNFDPNYAYYVSMRGVVRGAAFGNGTFVIVGQDGYIVQSGNLGGEPLILQEPQDRAAIVGNPASFTVQAVGAPPLAYLWFHNGSAIANATNSSHTISQVQASDGGNYRVIITNSFGSVTSRVAQLSVAFLDIDSYAGIKILGVPGRTYRIEATPSTGTPNWQVLTNLVLPSNPYIWIDYESPSVPARLYRAAELQ